MPGPPALCKLGREGSRTHRASGPEAVDFSMAIQNRPMSYYQRDLVYVLDLCLAFEPGHDLSGKGEESQE